MLFPQLLAAKTQVTVQLCKFMVSQIVVAEAGLLGKKLDLFPGYLL